jgi:membrane peptidoglycan carboxypeptidase
MLDADGNRIATLFDENRIEVPLDQISENMQRAIVAVEDERFYEHKGVDVQGLIRAQLENTASGSIRQGASTLTMQYVKNVLVTAAADEDQVEAAVEQTTARKLQEIRYAVQVGARTHQGRDPQPLPQHRVLRLRRVRRRGGIAALLRPQRQQTLPG